MITKDIEYFDLSQICNSGQCFRMNDIGNNTFCVISGDKYIEIVQEGEKCSFSCREEEFESFWQDYFDLNADYKSYINNISSRDKYLLKASAFGSGIRILKQDLWEMIVSFVISQQNNIVRIRRCIYNICEKFGEEKHSSTGQKYYAFPSPLALANASEEELRGCNLGYRAKYIMAVSKSVVNGNVILEDIPEMPYRKAKTELLKFYGIGEKVADCICLFALHHLEAFPVDTHIRQAIEGHYPKGFPKRRYKGYEGVMQQYIFYYELFGKS